MILLHRQCVWGHRPLSCCQSDAFQMHCMMDHNMTVLFCINSSISFDKILNTTGLNTAPNHGRSSTVFRRWLYTHTVEPLSWPADDRYWQQFEPKLSNLLYFLRIYSLSGVSLLLLSSSHWSQGHTAHHAEISQVYKGSCLKYSNVRVKWLCSLPHCRSWKKSLPPISHNFFSNYYQLIKDGAWILLKGAPKYFFFYFLFFITSIHVHFWNHCPEQCSRFPPLSEHSWLLISTPVDSAVMLAILQIYLDATLN